MTETGILYSVCLQENHGYIAPKVKELTDSEFRLVLEPCMEPFQRWKRMVLISCPREGETKIYPDNRLRQKVLRLS